MTNPLGLIRGGGLRAGRYFETRTTIRLRGVVYIPGVRISGDIGEGGGAALRISGGNASNGHLRFRAGHVSGVLGGRRVSGSINSLASPASTATAAVSRHLGR